VCSYLCPAGLLILQHFRYRSVLTNAQNPCHYSLVLPVSQGDTHALLPSRLLLAASSQQHVCPSAGVSTSTTSCEMTICHPIIFSHNAISLHPALRSYFYATRRYKYSCLHIIWECDFIFRLFVNFLQQLHTVLVNFYLVCGRTWPCLLLKAKMYQGLMLSHDIVSYIQRINEMVDRFPLKSQWPLMQRKLTLARQYRCLLQYASLTRFRFGCQKAKVLLLSDISYSETHTRCEARIFFSKPCTTCTWGWTQTNCMVLHRATCTFYSRLI
jgi:hypothetical protein